MGTGGRSGEEVEREETKAKDAKFEEARRSLELEIDKLTSLPAWEEVVEAQGGYDPFNQEGEGEMLPLLDRFGELIDLITERVARLYGLGPEGRSDCRQWARENLFELFRNRKKVMRLREIGEVVFRKSCTRFGGNYWPDLNKILISPAVLRGLLIDEGGLVRKSISPEDRKRIAVVAREGLTDEEWKLFNLYFGIESGKPLSLEELMKALGLPSKEWKRVRVRLSKELPAILGKLESFINRRWRGELV